MSEKNPQSHKISDDELLANAIPIEETDDLEEVTELEEAPAPAAKKKQEDELPDAIDLVDDDDHEAREIKMFGARQRVERTWKRQPNADGTGATRVRTFVGKLRLDAIEHLDDQINEWLEEHPEFEIKNVTVSMGVLKGKTNEEAIFINVWV